MLFLDGRDQNEGSYLYSIMKCKLFYQKLLQNKASLKLYKKIERWTIKKTKNHKSWYTFYTDVNF